MPPASAFLPDDSPELCPFLRDDHSTAAPGWHFPPQQQQQQQQQQPLSPEPPFALPTAYHNPEPSPPGSTFLDNILNPVDSTFAYHTDDIGMSSSRAQDRAGRLSNGYVDLTDSPVATTTSRKSRRGSPTPGPSSKRRRRDDGTAAQTDSATAEATLEAIDLSDEQNTVQQHLLQKQREEAVKAQAQPEEKPTTFNTFNCVICMDTPTDLTATACGHLFCHSCLMEALIAGENRGNPGEARRSQCPVCRKNINRTKSLDVIPLLLMKGLATQPRKTRPVAASTAPAVAATASKKPVQPRLQKTASRSRQRAAASRRPPREAATRAASRLELQRYLALDEEI